MKYCPITYEPIKNDELYSKNGMNLLSKTIDHIDPIPLTANEQQIEAQIRSGKMSIQGIQTKLSAQFSIKKSRFNIVDNNGLYILKTQSESYSSLPENESITMTLARQIGLEVPVNGLVFSKDNSMTYFIKRFDRHGHNKKYALEDFSQLLGESRETKYDASMEKVITVIERYTSFPTLEKIKLLRLVLFNYLVGNEDMHLKNYSLITRDSMTTLSPCYDLLNTSIALRNPAEEIALPLNGKKNNLTKNDLLRYFAKERLGLTEKVIDNILQDISNAVGTWFSLIERCYLSDSMKERYLHLLTQRIQKLIPS
jgi:serine/threonine-protein kinase HipA